MGSIRKFVGEQRPNERGRETAHRNRSFVRLGWAGLAFRRKTLAVWAFAGRHRDQEAGIWFLFSGDIELIVERVSFSDTLFFFKSRQVITSSAEAFLSYALYQLLKIGHHFFGVFGVAFRLDEGATDSSLIES